MSDVLPLTYDTLPPLSNLRREFDDDGHLRISIAAGDAGALARRAAMYGTAWVSVIWAIFITALFGIIPAFIFAFGISIGGSMGAAQPRGLIVVLMISVGVFFSAMFLLVWWLEYRDRMDVIERAALQATVVCVTREAVFIETVGPFGKASETIAHPFKLFARRMPGVRAECLHFVPRKGKTVHLFPGLSHGELCWIAAEIRTAMNAA